MVNAPKELHVAILAGGPGTRLWPLSTPEHPKPFLPIPGPRSLLQETYRRARLLAPASRIWVVGSRRHRRLFGEELPGLPAGRLLLEPEGRNTAAAIALAAVAALKEDARATLAVLPADHWVENPQALARALIAAARFAAKNHGIVCVGTEPTGPSTSYGYLTLGAKQKRGGSVRRVRRFTEKPDAARARRLVSQGALWNAGIFVFRAEVLVGELERHLPALHRPVATALRSKTAQGAVGALLRGYRRLPAISIDYAVMEKAREVYAVPCRCGWSDMGTWPEALRVAGGRIECRWGRARWLSQGIGAGESPGAVVGFSEAIFAEGPAGTLILNPDDAAAVGEAAKRAAKRSGTRRRRA